jgi:hypothetical protein
MPSLVFAVCNFFGNVTPTKSERKSSLRQKSTNLKSKDKNFRTKKAARKMLVKLTPVID